MPTKSHIAIQDLRNMGIKIIKNAIIDKNDTNARKEKRKNFNFKNPKDLKKFYEYFELEKYKDINPLDNKIIIKFQEIRKHSYKDQSDHNLKIKSLLLAIQRSFIDEKKRDINRYKELEMNKLHNFYFKLNNYFNSLEKKIDLTNSKIVQEVISKATKRKLEHIALYYFKQYIFGNEITKNNQISLNNGGQLKKIKEYIQLKIYQKYDNYNELDKILKKLFIRAEKNTHSSIKRKDDIEISNELLILFKTYLIIRKIKTMIANVYRTDKNFPQHSKDILNETLEILKTHFKEIIEKYHLEKNISKNYNALKKRKIENNNIEKSEEIKKYKYNIEDQFNDDCNDHEELNTFYETLSKKNLFDLLAPLKQINQIEINNQIQNENQIQQDENQNSNKIIIDSSEELSEENDKDFDNSDLNVDNFSIDDFSIEGEFPEGEITIGSIIEQIRKTFNEKQTSAG